MPFDFSTSISPLCMILATFPYESWVFCVKVATDGCYVARLLAEVVAMKYDRGVEGKICKSSPQDLLVKSISVLNHSLSKSLRLEIDGTRQLEGQVQDVPDAFSELKTQGQTHQKLSKGLSLLTPRQ